MKSVFNKMLLILFFSFPFSAVSYSQELQPVKSTYYLSGGVIHGTDDITKILPNIGLGVRFQKGYVGFDASLNAASLIFSNYFSVKGLFLLHPGPLYFGCGPGWGRSVGIALMGQSYGGRSNINDTINLECVLGYEFRNNLAFKTFTQISLSQPLMYIKGHSSHYKPALQISAGIGF